MHNCWGAQAPVLSLRHPQYDLPPNVRVFATAAVDPPEESVAVSTNFLCAAFAHTEVRRSDIEKVSSLRILSESEESGVYAVSDMKVRQIFLTGHVEYDPLTLKAEYERDLSRCLPIDIPRNYFPNDDPTRPPVVRWRSSANLLFANWLNYYVYQVTRTT
jgi:homoserine O-succinyltransferase